MHELKALPILFDCDGVLVDSEHAAEAIAELQDLEERYAVDVREIPGAAALTAHLPADSWAVVTSGTRKIATARLAAAGIPQPKVLVTADDVEKGKPSPAPYVLAATRLGHPPQSCAVFEDAPAGIIAAQRVGVSTIVGVGPSADVSGVVAVVPDLRNIHYDGDTLTLIET
jgi:sugar-phosphatase